MDAERFPVVTYRGGMRCDWYVRASAREVTFGELFRERYRASVRS